MESSTPRATQACTPSKVPNMESSSPVLEQQHVRKDAIEKASGIVNDYETPSASTAEACTPTSSRRKARLGAATIGSSPSAGRGLNTPSLGFGARLRNVPSPITTRPLGSSYRPIRPVDMREPRPERQLPSFDETLIELAPIHGNTPSSNAQAPSTFYSSSDQPASEWLSREPQGFCSNDNDDRLKINWYTKRADQIGPSHRIPGLMHLGDLLTPPGWKCGDDPIDEAEAQKVYDEAREKARRALVVSSTESSRAEGPDIEKRLDERDMQWQTQLKLDEYILTEQKRIYNAWKQHRTKQAQQLASQAQKQQQQQHQKQYQQSQQNQHQQQQNLPQYYAKTRVLGRPQPMQPPTETSLLTYQRYRQSQVPASPHLYGPSPPLYGPSSPLYGPSPPLYGPSPPLSGGSLNSRIQILQRGIHMPQRSPMSPTFLDPSLIPQSVESMYNHYSFNRALIRQMDVENEKFLTQWSTKFGIPKSRGPNFPAVIPQATDPRAAPARNGHVPQIQRPWSPSQARFGGMREPGGRLSVEQAPFKTASAVGRNGSDPTQNHAPISSREIKWCAPSLKQNDRHAPLERKLKKTDSPQSGKRSHKPNQVKQKTWYHEEIANANLPLSIISHEALQAGIDFKANGDAKQSVTKSRGRPGVTTIDPKKGFVISDKGAKALISKGASDATNKQGPPQVKALLAPPLAFTSASTGISSLYHASSNAGHQVSAVRDEGQQLIRTGGVIVDHQNPQEEATVSAPSSEFSGSSSDTPDDPKDANYGQRGQRKPATPRTISGSRKAGTTCKKRKSEAPEPAKKRTRHPLDGAME